MKRREGVFRRRLKNGMYIVGVSTQGSLDRRVKLSLRVPAQMGWREMEHKGGKTRLVLSCARGMRLQ
jgi:hypothetical protein